MSETINPEAEYWNNEGGERWVRYIDRLETLAGAFSASLIEELKLSEGEKVLDIGCGGGPTSAAYAKAVGSTGAVLGLDISETILKVARERFGHVTNLNFMTADAGTHSFNQDTFDVMTSRFGVMFFPDPINAFTNIRKALKPSARVAFMCWRSIKENPWMGAPAAAAFTVLPAPEKSEPGSPGPFSLSDPERVQGVLKTAGFTNISCEKVDQHVNLGTVEEALETLCNLGPAAAALRKAGPAERSKALTAIQDVLEANQSAEGVKMLGATWLVSASAS